MISFVLLCSSKPKAHATNPADHIASTALSEDDYLKPKSHLEDCEAQKIG